MFTLVQLSTGATFGYLCSMAGFLIIAASVVFVIKGQAVLGDRAQQTFKWGKISASLTSAVALFFLGAGLIALPFWSEAQAEAREVPTAILSSKITGQKNRGMRLLLVEKPDYDQNYGETVSWQFPLVANKLSYSVIYLDGDTMIHQESFSVEPARPGSPPQRITLPPVNVQTGKAIADGVTPQLEVSDEDLKKFGVH